MRLDKLQALILILIVFSNPYIVVGEEEDDFVEFQTLEIAGAIRIENGICFIINDTVHRCLNVRSVVTLNDSIVLRYSFVATEIHTFVITPDETYVRLGFFIGASVLCDKAILFLSRIVDGNVVPVNPQLLDESFGNFWFYGLFTVEINTFNDYGGGLQHIKRVIR